MGFEQKKASIPSTRISRFINIPENLKGTIIKEECGYGFDGYHCELIQKFGYLDRNSITEVIKNLDAAENSWNYNGNIYFKKLISLNPYPVDLNISWNRKTKELKYEESNGEWTTSLRFNEFFKEIDFIPEDFVIINKGNANGSTINCVISERDHRLMKNKLFQTEGWNSLNKDEFQKCVFINKNNKLLYRLRVVYNVKFRSFLFGEEKSLDLK